MGAYLTCLRCGHHVRLDEMAAHAGPHTSPPAEVVRRNTRRDTWLGWGLFAALVGAAWVGLRAGSNRLSR